MCVVHPNPDLQTYSHKGPPWRMKNVIFFCRKPPQKNHCHEICFFHFWDMGCIKLSNAIKLKLLLCINIQLQETLNNHKYILLLFSQKFCEIARVWLFHPDKSSNWETGFWQIMITIRCPHMCTHLRGLFFSFFSGTRPGCGIRMWPQVFITVQGICDGVFQNLLLLTWIWGASEIERHYTVLCHLHIQDLVTAIMSKKNPKKKQWKKKKRLLSCEL